VHEVSPQTKDLLVPYQVKSCFFVSEWDEAEENLLEEAKVVEGLVVQCLEEEAQVMKNQDEEMQQEEEAAHFLLGSYLLLPIRLCLSSSREQKRHLMELVGVVVVVVVVVEMVLVRVDELEVHHHCH